MTKAKGGYKIKENGKKDTGHPTVMTPETIAKLLDFQKKYVIMSDVARVAPENIATHNAATLTR